MASLSKDLNKEEEEEMTVEELRALAENLNFNLTSVLQNPRAGNGSTKTLYEEFRDFDPFRYSFNDVFKLNDDFENELDPGKLLPPPPVPLPSVTMDMFHNYIDKNGALLDKFVHNHRTKQSIQEKDQDERRADDISSESNKMAKAMEGGSVPTPNQVYAEVPALFQKAHFTLAEPAVFEQVSGCPDCSAFKFHYVLY